MKVRFFAYIREITGTKEIQHEHCLTVRDLLQELSQRYGHRFREKVLDGERLSSQVIILVNGRNIVHIKGLDTPLKEDDQISIFPVVAGG